VVLFQVVLYHTGISALLGVNTPPKLSSPDIYRPLFWGGLWGIPFGLITWKRESHYYLIGLALFSCAGSGALFVFPPKGRARPLRPKQRSAVHILPTSG
jgi:hypothetical protein